MIAIRDEQSECDKVNVLRRTEHSKNNSSGNRLNTLWQKISWSIAIEMMSFRIRAAIRAIYRQSNTVERNL